MPRPPRRKTELSDAEITVGPEDDGLDVARFPNVVEEETAKEYRHARLPRELIPFVEYSDKFFSPAKQQAMAEKRMYASDDPVVIPKDRPHTITSGIDLLILKEKRRAAGGRDVPGELNVPFSVGPFSSSSLDNYYPRKLEQAAAFVEGKLYLEDAEGKPLSKFAIAHRMKAIGAPLPEGYDYLNTQDPCPSYWPDQAKYSHLWGLRHRVMEEA